MTAEGTRAVVSSGPIGSGVGDRAAPELAALRVLIAHEWLYAWAGAERCLEQLVELMPHAEVVAGVVTPRMRASHAIAGAARETWVGRLPGARARHRWYLPLLPAAFAGVDTRNHDLVISVSHSFAKATPPSGRRGAHLCYCLTPPRFLWDLRDAHRGYATMPQRLALDAVAGRLRAADRRAADRVTRFVAISDHVAARVKRCYGRDCDVVYPPVALKPGAPGGPRDRFLLSLGRLVPYKRVDLAVEAASRLGMRLVVAGDGPERARLERMAGPNVEFVGEVSEAEASRLLSSCAAFVFCADEDFGIAVVEANAHGAPVVAFGRGGVLETMAEGRTATFFSEETVPAVSAAIERCMQTQWDADALRANAARFSPGRFREGMRAQIALALSQR